MSTDPRRALTHLVSAFEHHLEVSASDADDAALEAAEVTLRDAFFTYDDELFTRFGVELPFDMYVDDDLDEDEDDEEDEDNDDILDIEVD